MKIKMNKIILLFFSIFLFYSCSGFNEAGKVLRNEKVRTTDEFLVKKKEPLELPPKLNEIPKPNTQENKKITEKKIEEILKFPKQNKSNNSSTSVEKTILDKIKK